MRTLTTMGARTRVALFLTALATMGASPGQALAASSGGWSPLGHGAAAGSSAINTKVETLLRVGSKLYVGGDFINAAGIAAADHVAVWNGSAWSAVGAGLGDAASAVYAIAVDPLNGKVYAGGSFQNASGDANADAIAVWTGTSWSSLNGVSLHGTVFALAIVGRTLYVGGSFDNAAGLAAADAVAAYGLDGGGWSAITDASGDIGGTVSSMAPDNSGGLFVGGSFSNADGITTADFVARYTGGTSWAAIGTGGGINNRVRALAVAGNNLYVGGDFTNGAGDPAGDKVLWWNGATWSALGSTSEFGDGGFLIYGLAVDNGVVYVCGYFNNAGGSAKQDGIAAWYGNTWRNVGTNAAGTDGPISLNTLMTSLAVVGSKVYIGGLDSSIADNTQAGYVASYRVRQPDAQIATTGTFIGNNVYNTTGASQTRTRTIHRGQSGTFKIKVSNDGFAGDGFKLKGPGSGGGFTVHYLDPEFATDVTAAIVAGTYTVSTQAAGQSKELTIKVTVGSGVSVGATHSFVVTATSTGLGTPKDAIKAIAKAS